LNDPPIEAAIVRPTQDSLPIGGSCVGPRSAGTGPSLGDPTMAVTIQSSHSQECGSRMEGNHPLAEIPNECPG
jgi:hypothetical protein